MLHQLSPARTFVQLQSISIKYFKFLFNRFTFHFSHDLFCNSWGMAHM